MGWTEYYTRVDITNNELKERIEKAYFHYKGVLCREWETVGVGKKKKQKVTNYKVDFNCLDLMVLLGIKDTLYMDDDYEQLTLKEFNKFVKKLKKQDTVKLYAPNGIEKTELTIDEFANKYLDRLLPCEINDHDDGSISMTLNGRYIEVFEALTEMCDNGIVDLWDIEDWDDGDSYCAESSHYMVENGESVLIGYTKSQGSYNDDEPSDDNEKKPTTYEIGMQHAHKGEYEKSIEILSTLKDSTDALNNIGVCYEKLGNYEKAYEYYLKAGKNLSLENILKLYKNKYIPMNIEEYKRICNSLIEKDDYHGYLYLSRLYTGNVIENLIDGKLAIDYAQKAFEKYPNLIPVNFNFAWCLCEFGQNDIDRVLCHKIFGDIICTEYEYDDDGEYSKCDDTYKTARFSYAYQCRNGFGCEKDVEKAIYWYRLAFKNGYIDSALELADIYETEEGYIDLQIAAYWKQKHKEKMDKQEKDCDESEDYKWKNIILHNY